MLFNSYLFILLFLPLCLLGYFLLNRTGRGLPGVLFLVGMSLWFYGSQNPALLGLIGGSVAVNFLLHRLMGRFPKAGKPLLILGIVLNLGCLVYFKYMDFFIGTLNTLLGTSLAFLEIALPLGISFFTFQQLSFLIDSYHGKVESCSFPEYACYVCFFAQLVAGPIVSHEELIPQLRNPEQKRPDPGNLSAGLWLFVIGLSKKVLLADFLGILVNWGYENLTILTRWEALLTILGYTFQIYFDFSGYCDMALGCARMLNLDLPLNFRTPYRAVTITEFWERWHMTLTRFFTRYVYIPLGGNRRGTLRTCGNVMVVFLVSGLWHGASWSFVLWGALHGVFSVITRLCHGFRKVPKWLTALVTALFLNVTWILFRSESLPDTLLLLSRLKVPGFLGETLLTAVKEQLDLPLSVLPFFILGMYLLCGLLCLLPKCAAESLGDFKPTRGKALACALLLALCLVSLSGVSTFLYFNF